MDQITLLLVDQDVSIVTIFNLQNVRHQGVCSLRANEVFPCSLENSLMLSSEVIDEELIERFLVSFSNRVSRYSVGDYFNDPANIL